ncbi:acetyl-CoA carboxylase biotin carboxylase subunit family protein [Kitasatospora sp. NPDC057223]|uniref:ATP-grasp domain-containing protein n=1 Tax=Kitasatospora sp. NPDC057223 TaxID=3346055 RepID=UPI003633501E
MATQPTVIYVGTRRGPHEANRALMAARDAGYRVALLGSKAPGIQDDLIHDFEKANLSNRADALEAALRLAGRTGASGALAWTDGGVELAAAISEKCGWRGVPVEAAHRARNKHSMRQALAGRPDLIPQFRHVTSLEQLLAARAEIGAPAVLKPAGGSGSRSILQVEPDTDLTALYAQATALTLPSVASIFADYPGEFVYEERLGGTEHSVEGFVHDGRTYIAGITDKQVTFPYYVEYQEIHPSALPSAAVDAVHALTVEVTRAIGLDWCGFHLECRVLPDGTAKLLEIAARPGGGFITSHLVPGSTGIPFHGNLVRLTAGEVPDMEHRHSAHFGARSILSPTEGVFQGFDGLDDVLRVGGVEHFVFGAGTGDQIVLPPGDAGSCELASVLVRAAEFQDVEAALERAAALARPRIG